MQEGYIGGGCKIARIKGLRGIQNYTNSLGEKVGQWEKMGYEMDNYRDIGDN